MLGIKETSIIEIGTGSFGAIYEGVYGQDAINFLIRVKGGEVRGALRHLLVGFIDLVWGSAELPGFGLAKILKKHPDVIATLADRIYQSEIIEQFEGRVVLFSFDGTQRAVVDLQWFAEPKTWLVTAYIPLK